MSVESMIYKELVDDAGVGVLVGDRIYPLVVPQDVARPFVMYERLASNLGYTHDGIESVQKAPFRFTLADGTYAEVADAHEALVEALDVPVVGDGTTHIFGVLFSQADDGYDGETGMFSRTVMADVIYRYGN